MLFKPENRPIKYTSSDEETNAESLNRFPSNVAHEW